MVLRREGRVNPDMQIIKQGLLGLKKKKKHFSLVNSEHNSAFTNVDNCSRLGFVALSALLFPYDPFKLIHKSMKIPSPLSLF